MIDEDDMGDNSPLQSKMDGSDHAKKQNREHKENEDLDADFGTRLDQHDDGQEGGNEDQAEMLKEKFDEFWTSESDEIEDDLIDGESSDSDSDHGGNISPKSFDDMVQRQN